MERIVGATADEMFLRSVVGIESRSQYELEHCELRVDISFIGRCKSGEIWRDGYCGEMDGSDQKWWRG